MNIYDSYIEAGQSLKQRDKERFYTALIEYLAYGKKPTLSGASHAVFTAIEPSLEISIARRKSGSAGGRKKQENRELASDLLGSKTVANDIANGEANALPKNKSNSKKKVSPNGDTKEKPRFTVPNVEQIATYAAVRGYPDFDAQRFFDYYESNGWKVGRNPMKDWQAAVRTWLSKEPKGGEVHDYSAYDR